MSTMAYSIVSGTRMYWFVIGGNYSAGNAHRLARRYCGAAAEDYHSQIVERQSLRALKLHHSLSRIFEFAAMRGRNPKIVLHGGVGARLRALLEDRYETPRMPLGMLRRHVDESLEIR